MKKIIFVIVILYLYFISPLIFAVHQNSKLSQLNQNIQSIQTDLKKSTNQKNQLQVDLKKIELSENQIKLRLINTKKNLTAKHHHINQLSKNTKKLSSAIQTKKTALNTQIYAAYLLSQQSIITFALNADSVNQYQRLLTYFHYLALAQTQHLKQLKKILDSYQHSQTKRTKEYQTLLLLKKTEVHHQLTLQQVQQERKKLINFIDQHIQTKQEKLEKLIRDKKRLEKTLAALNKKHLQRTGFKGVFARLQGKLSWPVQGRVRHLYDTQIDQSELRWNGTLIDASEGKPVHAVAAGQVVFAKWLSGYGLMIIIDHGDGYMTLYGRNQSLLKHEGDFVTSNEMIATVGKSGGFDKTALYFGIRHDAKPLNPEKWCR